MHLVTFHINHHQNREKCVLIDFDHGMGVGAGHSCQPSTALQGTGSLKLDSWKRIHRFETYFMGYVLYTSDGTGSSKKVVCLHYLDKKPQCFLRNWFANCNEEGQQDQALIGLNSTYTAQELSISTAEFYDNRVKYTLWAQACVMQITMVTQIQPCILTCILSVLISGCEKEHVYTEDSI